MEESILRIGDVSSNGQVTIVDEDRLCYLVKSESRGAFGLRTISKALLKEYVQYFKSHPESNANNAREDLSGQSDIDKFEYGYTSTLTTMAKMILELSHSSRRNYESKEKLPFQQIFYGAPGTGKSHSIKDDENVIAAEKKNLVFRTTFHPDSDYSTFVGCYKPTMRPVADRYKAAAGKDEEIAYSFVPQAFLHAYVAAWNNPGDKVFLVIEEINRGNCAQIFGDLFQLLDRDEDGWSEYPIMADKDIAKYLSGNDEEGHPVLTDKDGIKEGKLRLPKNLHIWATMNTSDQSLFPIDSAFKRRWDWQYMPISDGKKGWQITANGKRYDWWEFLQKMNDKIGTATNSEDKKLGYFFCKAKNGVIDAETFVGKVVFYIWNDVFKDFAEEAGDLFKDVEGILSFNKFYTVGMDGKTKVVEEKVERLLQNLGVEPLEETLIDDSEDTVIGDTDSGSRRVLNVEFEDETIAIKRFPQYLQVLQKIGLDKVESVAAERQVDVLGCALVSKNKEDAIEKSDEYTYYEADGYYVIKGIRGKVMLSFLPLVSDRYNLNLKIAYK